MKPIKLLAIGLAVYLGLVIAFECLVGFMGRREAEQGVKPGEMWLVIATQAAGRSTDTVVAGVESGGHLYVSANHWPRGWYQRAVANPDVEIVRSGETTARRAVPVTGAEREQIARDYPLPFWLRLLTGFPPRSYLRLDLR